MKFEKTQVFNLENAIRGVRKGYRKTKNLGTYDTEEKAQQRIFSFCKDRIEQETNKFGLQDVFCKVYKNKYLVFENGIIFNLYGKEIKEIKGHIDHCGYREVSIKDKQELVHRSENTKHAYTTGLEKKCLGENKHTHKLTEENVKFIREHYKPRDKQYSAVKLGRLFGVTEYTIKDIIHRKSWGWL